VHVPTDAPRASPLAMTVLFMLMSGPIHPYEMQRRMKLWGKDIVVNVAQRASLYKTIDRLVQAGLIAVLHTQRGERFPDRTVYELTDAGLRTAREWLVEMLAIPRNEFPRFPAALSFIMALSPEQAADVLEQRETALREQLEVLQLAALGNGGAMPPRVTLLETEYLVAMAQMEFDWLTSIISQLRSGALSWTEEELRESALQFMGE
jgi:DNA-binding PadR family transcriptional regulator